MDVGAFTELVQRHQAAVAAVAYAIVRDRAIAHDLTQEAFVKAWRHQDELRDPDKAGAWLAGIVRFLARDHRRLERRRGSLRDRHVDAAPAAPPTPTPLDEAIARADDALLAAVVADLPERYREPLLLHYVAGCSVAEIAQTLSLREDAVKQRLSRARAALRDEPRFAAAAALALAPLPSFTDATVRAATTTPPVSTQEPFMKVHPVLTASLVAGALAAGGLALAASRGGGSPPDRERDTNPADGHAGTATASPAASTTPAHAPAPRDRAALVAAIRAARSRARAASSTAAAPTVAALEKVYDFAGESLSAGVPPPPPSLTAHTVLTKSAIRAALSGARGDVLACYEAALTRTPNLAGTLTVRVVIEGEPDLGGVISDASITDVSTITDAALATCVLDAIVSIELPAPDEGTLVTVHYPFTLSPH